MVRDHYQLLSGASELLDLPAVESIEFNVPVCYQSIDGVQLDLEHT